MQQHAVQPETDPQPVLHRFDMDIAGPFLHGIQNDRIHDADHRILIDLLPVSSRCASTGLFDGFEYGSFQ